MDRVSTFQSSQSAMLNLLAAEKSQNTASEQVTSGKVANDLQGFGHQAEALTAAKTLQTRVDGYVSQAKTLSSKLDAQDLALTSVSDAASGAHDTIENALATGHADGMMSALQSYFGQTVQALNSQFDGQYLFAGGQVNTAPVGVSAMSQLTTTPSTQVFKNDQLTPVAQIDESTTLQTGFLASNVGSATFDAFKQVQALNDGPLGPLSGDLTQDQITALTSIMASFNTAASGATDVAAQNGLLQNRVDDASKTQTDRQTMLTGMISGITDVDEATAVSNLMQSQLAVQASAQVFASLRDSSLLDYLK